MLFETGTSSTLWTGLGMGQVPYGISLGILPACVMCTNISTTGMHVLPLPSMIHAPPPSATHTHTRLSEKQTRECTLSQLPSPPPPHLSEGQHLSSHLHSLEQHLRRLLAVHVGQMVQEKRKADR